MSSNHLALDIEINASVEDVWSAISDWQGQSNWMLQTTVVLTSEVTEGEGVTIEAFTGPLHRLFPKYRFLGILDLMKVTSWQPPYRCDVLHYGSIIKGTGTFELEKAGENMTIFHWSEDVEAPSLLFALVKPFIWLGVRISLARFKRSLE